MVSMRALCFGMHVRGLIVQTSVGSMAYCRCQEREREREREKEREREREREKDNFSNTA